jgi:transcriptional regulator with XRE-family HTH domain
MQFGYTLKNLLENKGFSHAILAKHLDIDEITVRFWEANLSMPPKEMLIKIALFFNVSTEYLLAEAKQISAFEYLANIRKH